ncbi:hypothetical protein [Escherichia phage vB_EcoM_JNE01]|nr:hypothetical protein [Escherichia phage vB_EcoM_JNE01]
MAKRSNLSYEACETYMTKDGKEHRGVKPEYVVLREVLLNESYGSNRRNKILDLLRSGIEIAVNRKYSVQTKDDPDIKKLIKDGKIEMFNVATGPKSKCTYLRIKNG